MIAFLFTLITRPRQPAGFSFWGASFLAWYSMHSPFVCLQPNNALQPTPLRVTAELGRYDRSAFLFTLIARPRQPAGFSFLGGRLSGLSCSITTPCSSAGRYPFAVASCVRSRCAAGFPVPCGAYQARRVSPTRYFRFVTLGVRDALWSSQILSASIIHC